MKPLRKHVPILNILSQRLIDLPAPINISLWWNYGSLLGLFLIIQIIMGIFLSIHYCPNTELAFSSIIHISRNVNWGWILHNIHINGASFFLILIYLHMGRGLYYSSFYQKSMKHRYYNFYNLHNNRLNRICTSMRANKFLGRNSYYKHVFSHSIFWYLSSSMTMRRICSRKSNTKSIFHFTLLNTIHYSLVSNSSFTYTSWKRIYKSVRH